MVTPTGRGLDRKGRARAGSSSRQRGSQKAQLEFSTRRRETWREGRARDRERNPPGPLTGSRPSPAMGGISKWGRGLQERHPGDRREGPPRLSGGRRGFPSRASLSPSRLAPASSRRHNKGGRCRTAQAREPPGPLGMVVRPPDGRSPARAGGRRGRPSAHARPLPPGRAPPASGGRGFPVVRPRRRGRYPSLPIPPRPDWTIQLCAASRLAPEVASLFRAVLIYFSAA